MENLDEHAQAILRLYLTIAQLAMYEIYRQILVEAWRAISLKCDFCHSKKLLII